MFDYDKIYQLINLSAQFFLVILAAKQVGGIFEKLKLPVITGFLLTGILVGPHSFHFVSSEVLQKFGFIDSAALAFIAFMAGSEIFLKEYQERMKSIAWITVAHLVFIFTLGATATYMLSSQLTFLDGINNAGVISVSILAGAILVARSPSSAVAIIKEIRASGPFTQTILGVTVLTDVFVIAVFTICTSIAAALVSNTSLDITLILLIVANFVFSILAGVIVGRLLTFLLSSTISYKLKPALIVILGFISFQGFEIIGHYLSKLAGPGFTPEPLLICMIAGFYVTNFTIYRSLFDRLLHEYSNYVYLAFFTFTGLSLEIGIIGKIWPITLALVLVRTTGLFLGSFVGGSIAKDSVKSNCLSWMGFITQAGVGIGLAKSAALNFPVWGSEFATLMIAVIVVNQVVGPAFLKASIFLMKEAKPKAKKTDPGLIHNVTVFGDDSRTLALAKQLHLHHWQVKIAAFKSRKIDHIVGEEIESDHISEISLDELRRINVEAAGAVVCLYSDEENLEICRLIRENFENINLIVQLADRSLQDKFDDLNVMVVIPSTAMISLLDHFVRSPSAVALLLNMEDDQDIVDVHVTCPDICGSLLRQVKLPDGILIVSAHRGEKHIIVNGDYRIRRGDVITIVGPIDLLPEVIEKLEES